MDSPNQAAREGLLGKTRAGNLATSREAFWIALEALRSHKLRSFLTLLGIVIATFTLIIVMSIINGMNLYFADHIANLGANTFVLSQFQWAQGREAWLKARLRNRPIRIDDFEFLQQNVKGYKAIGTETGMNSEVRYRGLTMDDVELGGDTPQMINIGIAKVAYGRYITDSDYEHSTPVCFIGQDVVDKFFPSLDPVGKEIEINGRPFQVIGVAEKIGNTFGQSQDNFVQIPLSTYQRMFIARPNINISVQAWDAQQMAPLEDEVRTLMRTRRHVPYLEADTFGINASETLMDLWKSITSMIFGVTIALVAIFMVVGGIVIMNIMLASVTDRTHEIGIRKSLGARRVDILLQFMIEAGVMAGVGGLIGLVLAIFASWVVNQFFTSSVPMSAIIVGLVISTGIGLFFGIYPASKAAKLDPIEALRAEM